MKKLLVLVFVLSMGLSAFSQDHGIGIGVILGNPTGLSAKMWTSERTAVDGAAAWSFLGEGYIHAHADLLIHSYAIEVSQGALPLYFGLGGRVRLGNDTRIGIRIPLGISYQFEEVPFDAFFEIAPILDLLPETDFDVNGAIGLRYYL